MATTPGNTPQAPTSTPQFDYKAQRDFLKNLIDDQGDYNNLLKDSLKDLAKLKNTYDQIEARLENITDSSINVKEVEKELQKLGVNRYIESKKLQELQKDSSKETLDSLQEARNFTKDLVNEQERIRGVKLSQLEIDKIMQETLATQGNLEATRLFNQEKMLELADEQIKAGEKKLDVEKKLRKDVGFTGAAFKFLADKIGVGESYMEDMVTKARLLNEQGKKFTFVDKIMSLGKASLGALGQVFKDPLAFAAAWTAVSAGFDKLGGAAASVGKGISGLSDESSTVVSGIASGVS